MNRNYTYNDQIRNHVIDLRLQFSEKEKFFVEFLFFKVLHKHNFIAVRYG